jgi:hypothetical protein
VTEPEIDAEVSAWADELATYETAIVETTRWPWAVASHRPARRGMLRVTQAFAITGMVAGVATRDETMIGPVCAMWVLAYGWAWLDKRR